ncbi:MAG TPA: polyprenyl diphosphate synthase [Acidiferrobacter sp.]|nr:polyprenyl diphosphate synthase [Acidiferrobacter sp.]
MKTTDPTLPHDTGTLPKHIAVIMDGNGRWAKARGLARIQGHQKGVEMVRDLVAACAERGIEALTLFAFSSENWRRPKLEVRLLRRLFLFTLEREISKLHANGIRFCVIGDIAPFGAGIVKRVREAQELTRDNARLRLTIAANYGGRWDIARACAQMAREVQAGRLKAEEITPESLTPYLSMGDVAEPDLFIRTGGEQRISNFLLWQLAYTEFHFTPVLWPDFDRNQFDLALQSFATRQRRFGRTGDQVEASRRA